MMTSNANGLQGSSAQPASRLETWSMAKTSLAERLGYGADDRLLIVNCDDLGSSHGANAAIHRALVYGAISTSASLMVPCPWAREAAHHS